MGRVPMTVREQLLRALELGHELHVQQAGPWPEHGDPHPKFWIRCTCGYESTARRSRAAVNGVLAWHLGKVIGWEDEASSRDGVTPRPPVEHRAR